MDRLTCKYEGENVLREFCAFDRESETEPDDCDTCFDMCKEFDGQGCESCPIQKAVNRLSAYEDIGLTPERLKELDNLYLEKCNEINRLNAELEELKKKVPPCNTGDTIYLLIPGIMEVLECEVIEIINNHCGEHFKAKVEGRDLNITFQREEIGKTIFLTAAEVEEALEKTV